jgi:hypothetical protein
VLTPNMGRFLEVASMNYFCNTLINSILLNPIETINDVPFAIQFLIRSGPEMHDEIMVANKQALSNCEQIFAYIISFLKVSLVLVDNANMSVRDKYNSPLFEKEYFILHYFG